MNKLTTLSAAVRTHVRNGTSVYITGFSHLINFAAGHELIRSGVRGLTLIRLTPDLIYDQLVGNGSAERLVFSYLGNPGVGDLPSIRRGIENGTIDWLEYTHGSMIAALRAGACGAPFAVVPTFGHTDLVSHQPDTSTVVSPFDGLDVPVTRPLNPDVAFVHVQRADAAGNCLVWGATGDIREAAMASRRVIVTAEEIVDEAVIRADPNRVLLPGLSVDAVVHLPWAAHPSFAQGYYARDNRFYRTWNYTGGDEKRLRAYLDAEVFDDADRTQYVMRHQDRLTELAQIGATAPTPINYGGNKAMAGVQE